MKFPFVKMHGAGNDFVLVDNRTGAFPADRATLAKIGARRTGVGCEGIILVEPSEVADFRMRFFNPDGSEAELCGNGARCVAAFARSIGAARADRMRFETLAGIIEAEILSPTEVRVRMPPPKDLRANFVNTGVPHAIVPVADIASVDVEGEGRKIRHSPAYAPAGTNVDFVCYAPPHAAAQRTYERGVEAESGACGTGAVATAVVGVAQHGLAFPVSVTTAGGTVLTVDGILKDGKFSALTLAGPVARVFEGVLDL